MSHSVRWTLEKITQRLALIEPLVSGLCHENRLAGTPRPAQSGLPGGYPCPAGDIRHPVGQRPAPDDRNTSWDWARFETCAHKWVDLSEGGYGVSLLNDCKYGHDIRDNILRLSLLRAPTVPDPEADQGQHHFTYSLLPHTGGWEAGTAAEAYRLNDPVIGYRCPVIGDRLPVIGEPLPMDSEKPITDYRLPITVRLLTSSAPNIIIETINRAEDGNGLIVRFYESQRRRANVTLTTAFLQAQADRVNLLEEAQETLIPDGNQVTLFVKPYEIVSLRLVQRI